MEYEVVIENAGGNYSAYVPDLPGCVATGKNEEEARKNIQEAIRFHIEGLSADGVPIPEPSATAQGEPPRVFVSYTHESPSHKEWVASLCHALRTKGGVDARLDQWHLHLGQDVLHFVESEIRTSKRVLLVCTPTYARKADEGQGGVGYEKMVVTGELAADIASDKFICVLCAGTPEDAIPSFAKSRLFIDFRNDEEFEEKFDELIRDIHDSPLSTAPPIGGGLLASPKSAAESLTYDALPPLDPKLEDNLQTLAETASSVVRAKDLAGWRQLVLRERKRNAVALAAWRDAASSISAADAEEWAAKVHEAVDAAAPFYILALTAAGSGLEEISRQSALLDDLLTPREWEYSGPARVVNAPQALAMVYHYLLGGQLMSQGRHADAIELLRTPIVDPRSTSTSELWKHHSIIGWTDSLDRNCDVAWSFLLDLYGEHRWLQGFFVDANDFIDSLRAYQFIASLLELSDYLHHKGDLSELVKSTLTSLDVPPMFLLPAPSQQNRANDFLTPFRIAIPHPGVISTVGAAYGIHADAIDSFWPDWFRILLRWHFSCGRRFLDLAFGAVPSLIHPGRSFDLRVR